MRRVLAVGVVVAGALAGCTGSSAGTRAATTTPASPTVETAARSYPGVGDTVVREDAFSVTLLDFEDQADLGPEPDRRSHWAAARVRFCWRKAVTDDDARPAPGIDVTWAYWSVVDAAEGRTTAGPVKGAPVPDWRTPVYPRSAADATLRPGECVAGWMGFAAPDDQEIRYVRYAPRQGGPTIWAV